MTNDCKTCPVSTGTHKPAEAVHQIDEPQTDALDLADKLEKDVWQATPLRLSKVVELAAEALRAQSARIAELEADLEAVGAGGVQRLAAAPQAVQDAAQAPDSVLTTIGWLLDDAMNAAVKNGANSISMPDAYVDLAAWLAGIPAHPAEGVPQAITDEREAFVNWLHGTYPNSYSIIQAADLWFHKHVAALAWKARAAIAATHPTQQGLADDAERLSFIQDQCLDVRCTELSEDSYGWAVYEHHMANPKLRVIGESFKELGLREAIDAARRDLAAQAKQGEQANG